MLKRRAGAAARNLSPAGGEDSVVLVLATLDALDVLDDFRYVERRALVQLAVDLEHPSAADDLADFVQRPIGDEQTEDTAHGLNTVTEEVVLRTTAIEGLARLGREGVDTTDALLQTISSSDYVAMRRAAWFAMVDGGSAEGLERAGQFLDDRGDGWIPEFRRPVQEAEQQDPESINEEVRIKDRLASGSSYRRPVAMPAGVATTTCSGEAGAVPGWVWIARMIPGLVAVAFQLADDQIGGVLTWAADRVPW